ncbi:MAG: hypothetical protein NUV45_04375 [Tepidanaerobacteraceae bacterium]|jgi:uncharacterized membrane protein YczE|nr:hypothetical protein [Tepidanaerobacteraceae bacterium]
MTYALFRVARLFLGLFLYAVGIVMTINANLGLAPWDVFHQGLAKMFHITMGQASISVGIILVLLNSFLSEKLGWGTLGNMLFVGLFIDFLMFNNLIPIFQDVLPRFIMMFLGMFIIGIASCLYMGAGLGSGPRDGLMVVIAKRTGKSVGLVRNAIEISVLMLGCVLGGFVGIGTPIMAFTVGFFVQLAFKLFKFDVSAVQHRFIDEDIKHLGKLLSKSDSNAGTE